MSQDALNTFFFGSIVFLVVHAGLQHRTLNCVTMTLGYLLTNPDATLAQAQDVARKLGLIDESDA